MPPIQPSRLIAHTIVALTLIACSTPATTPTPDNPDPTRTAEAQSTAPPSTATPIPPTDAPPAPRPEGRLAFEMHFDVGLSELQVVDLDCDPDSRICTRTPTRLLCQPLSGSSPAWSPDGSRIAFSSTQEGGDSEIYLAPFASMLDLPVCPPDLIALTDNDASDITPAWSPDGTRIVFASNRSGSFNLYIMDDDGSNRTALTSDGDFHAAPTWSPDGLRIAFETRFANNRSSIFVIDPNGENLTLLSDPGENASNPAWSPDGSRIAFVSDRDGSADLFLMDPDGENVTPVTRSPGYDGAPAWSPDGQWLAYTAQQRDSLDIYIIPLSCLDAPTPCDDQAILLWDNVLIEAAPAWQPLP